jgi:hypothetical protein
MPDPVLEYLLQELDFAVIEWLPDRTFRMFLEPPRWFRAMAQWHSLPFLEHFFPEAEAHWRANATGVLSSGPFMIDDGGNELLLRVRALKLEGRLVMAIERLTGATDIRPILREARQQALTHEQLENRARRVHGLAAGIAGTLDQLKALPLADAQRPLVETLLQSSAALTEVAGTLPPSRARRTSH